MSQPIRQSTASSRLVGPVLDNLGAAYTGMVTADFNITKNGTTAVLGTGTATHSHNGYYVIAFATDNTDTLGGLSISCNKATYLMTNHRWEVIPATLYDALQIELTASGSVVDIKRLAGTVLTGRDIGSSVLLSSGTGTGQVKLSSGYVAPNWGDIGNPTTTVGLTGTTVSLTSAGVDLIWNALTSGMSTAGSIGKKFADWVLGTDNKTLLSTDAQTGVVIPTVSTVTDGAKSATALSNATWTNGRAALLDNLDVAISTIQNQILAINNLSAKTNWFGSSLLEIPDSGTREYLFELVVKDDEDKLTNLDANPTIALTNAAGTDRSSLITTTVANPSTGRYTVTITVGTATANESLKLTATGTISVETRYAAFGLQVVDYDSATLINQIYNAINALNDLSSAEVTAAVPTVADIAAQVTADHGSGSYVDSGLTGVTLAPDQDVNVTKIGGSAAPVTNLTTVFSTDFATAYDATNKAWLSKLGDFAMGGSSLALTLNDLVVLSDFQVGGDIQIDGDLRTSRIYAFANDIAWNAAWDAEVQSKVQDAINASSLATSSQVQSLQVNTRANIIVPEEIELPDAGTQLYRFTLSLMDVDGNTEIPDSTPTFTLANVAGTDRSSRLSAASNPSDGRYYWNYTATAGDSEEQILGEITVIEGGKPRIYNTTTYIVEESAYRFSATDRNTLNSRASQTSVDDLPTNAELATALAAADDATLAAIAAEAVKTAAIRLVTDKLDTGLVADASVWQFTVNMLELGPAGEGGGGDIEALQESVDAIAAEVNKIPRVGKTHRFKHHARDAIEKTADVSMTEL